MMNNKMPIKSNSQSLGDIGEKTVALIFSKYSWSADLIKSDFGEDISCTVFIDNSRTYYYFRCQVKSTKKDSKYIRRLKDGNFSVSIETTTLNAWINSYFPIFLVIYEEEADSCFWCSPTKQVLGNLSKLGKKKSSIIVPKQNTLNNFSRQDILNEIKDYYNTILRLDESFVRCQLIPVIMPSYKVIPFYPSLLDFIHNNDSNLILNVGANLIEMLPSWMSILKRIEPNNSMPVIVVDSQITELDIFNKELKEKLKDINYKINDNQEWISFIISPIKILSTNNNSLWLNEMTSWLSYSLIGNKIHNDFEYAFEAPEGFLRQTSRRARSWDYFHFVNPAKDVALQLFGCYDVTPTIKAINESHFQNVKGQYIVWKCSPLEIQEISYIVHDVDLSVKLLEDLNEEESIITISTRMFDPFMGLYCLSPDWNSFENGSVREILNRNHLLSKLPGAEYTGTVPDFFEEAINNYKRNYKQVIVTELEYIVGFPIKHNERRIQVSRFQMINERYASDIKSHMNSLKPIELKDSELILSCIDNTWGEDAIYELSFSWTPDIFLTSKEDYIKNEKKILSLLNNLLPTRVNNNHILKNTYEIIHSAGEIGFDYQE